MQSIDLAAIDLNLLVAFEALFEERSVTAAAQRLYLGQPAMSAALGRLRTMFEDELFIRMGREMQPTSKALELAPGILSALQHIRQTIAASQVFDPASSQRSFAIGSSDYTSYVIVPKLLEICQNTAPGIDFRLIGFDKDNVGNLLERGEIDLALGVFQQPPRQTSHSPLYDDRFIGIARKGHPAVIHGSMSLEMFSQMPHALFTIRRDATGKIDEVLASQGLQRRIALTTSHTLVLPAIISASDLVAAIPARLAARVICLKDLDLFELPVQTEPWTISMLWSKLADQDHANRWLRQTLKTVCEGLG